MTAGSLRVSSSLLVLAAAACVDHEGGTAETQSLRVTVVQPATTGSAAERLPDDQRDIVFEVKALGGGGQIDRSFSGSVDAFVFSLGTVEPVTKAVVIENGEGDGSVTLPLTYGQTYLWLEDAREDGGRAPTFATGTSPILWYRDPTLEDVSRPGPGQNVLYRSPLEGKQVTVSTSKLGPDGRLVVTGVYASGFTVSDADCGALPCVGYPFGHVFVYSFSRPIDDRGRPVRVGQTLAYVSGGSSEFNGFTELNFPSMRIDDVTADAARVPSPILIDPDWLINTGNMARLEEQESALVMVEDVTVCALDGDYVRFAQWKVNVGLGCGKPINLVTAGQVSGFDPAQHVGQPIRRIVGTLKGVNFSSFNVWIVQPRTAADLTLE